MIEEMGQLFCEKRLSRFELEERCLRGDHGKIYEILKRADKVGEGLFFASADI